MFDNRKSEMAYGLPESAGIFPSVANGIVDGDKSTNPHYRYGGLWKNLHV